MLNMTMDEAVYIHGFDQGLTQRALDGWNAMDRLTFNFQLTRRQLLKLRAATAYVTTGELIRAEAAFFAAKKALNSKDGTIEPWAVGAQAKAAYIASRGGPA